MELCPKKGFTAFKKPSVIVCFTAMINKSSTTWRQLPDNRKTPGSDAEWKLLLKEYPQLIRRPVIVTSDGVVSQGFSDNGFKKRFGVG